MVKTRESSIHATVMMLVVSPALIILSRIFIPTLDRTTLVVVYGSVNDDHGTYMFSGSEPAPHWPTSQYFNGSSPWIAINEVVWFGVITGGQLLGQNLEGGMWFDVSRVDFVEAIG